MNWRRFIARGALGGAVVVVASLAFGLPARAATTPPDTIWAIPEELHPKATYGSFRAACDRLEALLRRHLGAYADTATWSHGPVKYRYHDQLTLEPAVHGRRLLVLGERDTVSRVPGLDVTSRCGSDSCPSADKFREVLEAAGWASDPDLDADGPDGTHFAMVCREAICDVDGRWDGGDDSDSTYVRIPGITLHVMCVPRPPRNPELAKHGH